MDRKAAKKARNIAAHAARFAALQEKQAAEKHAKIDKAFQAALDRQAMVTIKANAKFVADALAGTHAMILNHWLKGREATFARVQRFFDERPQLQPLPATEKAA